jgi:hypothetical protein
MVPAFVLAQAPDSIKAASGADPQEGMGAFNGDANFGMIDGDLFTTINLGLSLDLGKVGLGFQVPLRLRVVDNDPKNDSYGGVLRKEDWDEFSDYLKIIRYFRYGRKGEFIHLMVGSLPGASIGHGTIVNNYHNNIDLDHYKMGLVFDLNTDYGGFETLLNNAVDPTLFGTRAYIRPWSFVDPESYFNNLAVGFSVVSDVTSPYTLVPDTDNGGYVVEDGYPKVASQKAATIIGGDIEFKLLNTEIIDLTPYIDLNHILDAGTGFHAGILNTINIPVVSIGVQTRLEYRYFTGNYIPAYFNAYYEIHKFNYPFKNEALPQPAEDIAPKRYVLEQMGEKGLNGYFAELTFDFMGLFTLGGAYDDYDGLFNSNLRLYLNVPALEVFQFGAYYFKQNFEGADQAFTLDDKSLFLIEGRYQISSIFYLVGQYWRIWQLNMESGKYEAVNDWSFGVGMSYNF